MALPFLTIALLLSSCTLGGDDDIDYNKTLLEAGTAAPDFTFFTGDNPDGQTLASLRGSYVLIEFWRSTCGDCRDATPSMKRISCACKPEHRCLGIQHQVDSHFLPYQPARTHRLRHHIR